MGEKAIIAYFNSPTQAEEAKKRLQALQIIDMRVDRVGQYPGSGIDHIMNPITGDFDGLGELALSGDFSTPSAGILAAASPDASGMSDRGFDTISGKDVCLTVIVNEEEYDQALSIVEELGAMT